MHVPDDLFRRFAVLEEACIDASSIIYMQKAGFFDPICEALRLYSIPAITEEVGFEAHGIHLLQPTHTALTPDAQLGQCARERQLSIISEDKQILLAAKRAGLPYYNALIMLNWLLFRNTIDQSQYCAYHTALRAYARYGDAIWEYGAAVYQRILKSRNAVD